MLKHLKTLQHVSIIIQIIFRELVGSLLKSLNLKIFLKCKILTGDAGVAAPSPASPVKIYILQKFLNSVTLTRNLRAP